MESKKRILKSVLILICTLFLINFISATLSIGNQSHSIETKYGISQNIIGWINVSVSNESANSSFKDSLNNEISLLNLLKLNPSVAYSCTPLNCGNAYSATNGAIEKSLTEPNGTKNYGMLFSGNIISVNSISFNISATGIPSSCSNQLEVDFFDDGIVDFSNTQASTEICPNSKSYGCFDATASYDLATIESQPYCERISLPKAPGFRLGAWVKKNTGNKNITAIIYDKDGNTEDNANCILQGISTSGGEVYCDVNYSVQTPDDYYVCIYSTGTGEYVTRSTNSNKCGFWNIPPANENQAYYIFAEPKKFGSFSSINIIDYLNTGESLPYLTENYITGKYGSLNCANGCVVPVKFKTDIGAGTFSVKINNIKIDQDKEGAHIISDKLYDLSEIPAIINSSYGKLYLDDSGLKVKDSTGDFTYTLKFNGQKIFDKELFVEKTPIIKSLSPLKTTYAFPTKFEVNVDLPKNITKYEWNFGDNATATTTINKTSHVYSNSGNYSLKITIKDNNNLSSSRTFEINVTSPGYLINNTLEKMKKDLTNVKNQINTYDLFYRTGLSEIIDTNNLTSKINEIEAEYNSSNESEYNSIVSKILSLKVPEAIITTKTTSEGFVFYPERNNIYVDVLKSIEPGDYNENDEAYVESIYGWNSENMATSLNFKEISARYSGVSEPILKVFDFKIQEKTSLGYNSYFIIKDMANMKFKEDYGEKEINGYKYIELTGGAKEIIFSTTENISFANVPAFVSPPLSRLSIVEPGTPTESEATFNWKAFGIAIGGLLAAGIIIYIILHWWYKRKYEGHLFKHRNDLLNLFHFIDVQRKKGVSEGDIHEKLKKAGWSSEQIRYSMKKHSGKETGMPGIGGIFGKTK